MTGVEHGSRPAAADQVFAVDEEIGADLARVDWAATPLGTPEGWPQSLSTAVSILLSSRFAMWMAWGPQLTFFCNAAYRRDTLGRKYPWALGRPASEVWAEIWDDIGPRIHSVLTTGAATWDEALLLFLERAGYREETYHTFSYSPLRDDSGAVVGMLCVVSEDTERVVGERRMATLRDLGSDPSVVRTEEETLAFAAGQISRNTRDFPFTLTYLFEDGGDARLAAATGIEATHPAAAVRISGEHAVWPAATLARAEPVVLALDGATAFRGLPAGAWQEPPRQALLVPLLRQGAAPYGFLVAALNRYRPLDDDYRAFVELTAGHVAAGIASARSYQAQQRRAEELAELDRAKTAFFSSISHEFRTPLALIMGPVEELLVRPGVLDAAGREDLEVIRRNGLRLGKLVNTLLDFSRLEAGRMRGRFEPVDLSAATAELASVFRSAIHRAGLAFEVDCPPLPELVYLDKSMWEKVVLNLLSNALKFTFEGSVRVAVAATDGQAVVTVADTGIGVAAQEVPRLFERFYRIEDARSRSTEGSGIGLALVKELVALHGATITAASTAGEGTEFTIRVPFGDAHLPADALLASDGAVPSAGAVSATAHPFIQEAMRWLPDAAGEEGGRDAATTDREAGEAAADLWPRPVPGAPSRVLVADDNADMREYLARLLRSAGHKVETAVDGQAALDAVRRSAPDLIVSDVMMPRLDGLQLLAALRGDPRTAGTPVLLLSARAGQEESIEGLEAGADDYLVKPFSAAELLARVRANVELARLRNHHALWRTALIDSLQEAFFVCDEDGSVVEINPAFTDVLGYGPADLPYPVPHPWWPDAQTDPDAHQQLADALASLVGHSRGGDAVPVIHRDGRRMWVEFAYNQVVDPGTGRRVVVGTFRDVTAEHYAIRRESALAGLSLQLSEAQDLNDALRRALHELKTQWQAVSVSAVVFDGAETATLTGTDPGLHWNDLAEDGRATLLAARQRPLLNPVADHPAGAHVSLQHPDGTMVLSIDLGARRPFTEQDQTLLALLAGHLAQALHRIRNTDEQRETALALQRALLGPAQLPSGFAVRYQPATRPLRVGGDWYDVVALPDDRIGVVVGDCVGHGLPAATVMGQLRSACRALLLQNVSPAQTLTALDRFAAQLPGAVCTTMFCAVLDPATGRLCYASAGHPPAIVAHPDRSTQLLERGRSLPLAVRHDRRRQEAEYVLPARSTLLLYTDGLVERRNEPLTAGVGRAAAAVHNGHNSAVESLATALMKALAPTGGHDDVALLLYRHPGPLELDFPAEATRLASVRATLRTWLQRCDLDPTTIQRTLVAGGEACANAIEHGHRATSGGRVRLRASATADNLRLTVADDGRWKTPESSADSLRGRGLVLMRAFMDQVEITTGGAGTTVDMQARITR